MDTKLTEALKALAWARADAVEADARVQVAQMAYQRTPEYAAYEDSRRVMTVVNDALKAAEAQARELTLAAFRETGDKAPAKGAAIRLYTEIRYDDTEMLHWCQAHRPTYVMLSIDRKRIAKAAEDLVLDGAPINLEQDPRPTLATDLSEYLSAPANDAEIPYYAEPVEGLRSAKADSSILNSYRVLVDEHGLPLKGRG